MSPVSQYDLFVRDDSTHVVVEHTGWSDASKGGTLDIAATPFKIGLQLPHPGSYTLVIAGAIGTTSATRPYLAPDAQQFFWAQTASATTLDQTISAMLLPVPTDDDRDGDLFPDAMNWPADVPDAAMIPPTLLDCDDKNAINGVAPYLVNPFGKELCGDGVDEDCDGIDPPCTDSDGDGDPDDADCKPMDPKVHHPNLDPKSPHYDPYPETANCCGYSLGKTGMDAQTAWNMDPTCHLGTCGNGVDEDCSGADVPCKADQDCDSFAASDKQDAMCAAPANSPPGPDCNDCSAAIHPNAVEVCGDNIDNNCNGLTDETCVGCDLDGDGAQIDNGMNCPDAKYKASGKKADCNDEDAGVFPGSTGAMYPVKLAYLGNLASCNDVEGGTVCGALRGTCGNLDPDGKAQDADCNGTPIEGCPTAACDADHDGFIDAAKAGTCDPKNAKAPYDCDDTDPTTFPNAPVQCKEGKPHNCVQTTLCGTDADGDGFDVNADCDDNSPAVHPFATEICNGIDDDCDGLTDEGNPDNLKGDKMVEAGHIKYCTDSSVGECAKGPPGHCVCSAVGISNLHFDQANRSACPGPENDTVDKGAMVAPRCYGGAQPTSEVCDGLDNDCDTATADGKADCPGSVMMPPTCCGTSGCSDLRQIDSCLACGAKCSVDHGTPTCGAMGCAILSCTMPYGDCNQSYGDGCESDTSTDKNNCGACGTPCVLNHASSSCMAGKCVLVSCDAGYGDCNNNQADGCGTHTATDWNNCGMCGHVCDGNLADGCTNGACTCGGGTLCDGSKSHCHSGKCLLFSGQPCSSSGQCASNWCHKGYCN
jgi:hypothetical protein